MAQERTKIYFPLRSNIGWFQTDDLKAEISNQIKQALLLYDELIFEDGTFEASILSSGSSEFYLPPGTIPDDQRNITVKRDLTPSNMTVAVGSGSGSERHVVLHGRTEFRFKVDYFDILKEINAESYDFIKLITIDPNRSLPEIRRILQRQVFLDRSNFKDIHPNSFLRSFIIKNLNSDLISSILLESAIILDSRHEGLLLKKSQLPGDVYKFAPTGKEIAFSHLLAIAAPNFYELTMKELIKLRDDPLWSTFRGLISNIISQISIEPELLVNPAALRDIIQTKIGIELFKELKSKYPTGRKLTIDLGLGITSLSQIGGQIPGIISLIKSSKEAYKDRHGWFAFLLKLSK